MTVSRARLRKVTGTQERPGAVPQPPGDLERKAALSRKENLEGGGWGGGLGEPGSHHSLLLICYVTWDKVLFISVSQLPLIR